MNGLPYRVTSGKRNAFLGSTGSLAQKFCTCAVLLTIFMFTAQAGTITWNISIGGAFDDYGVALVYKEPGSIPVRLLNGDVILQGNGVVAGVSDLSVMIGSNYGTHEWDYGENLQEALVFNWQLWPEAANSTFAFDPNEIDSFYLIFFDTLDIQDAGYYAMWEMTEAAWNDVTGDIDLYFNIPRSSSLSWVPIEIIPEPSTALLLGTGVALLGLRRRRSHR